MGLITLPETHQRHSAPALCLSSKLPAKGGSAPALHLVSFYGNRKQLLVGAGDTQVKAGGAGGGKEPFIIFAPCTRLQHEAEMERRWGCFPLSWGWLSLLIHLVGGKGFPPSVEIPSNKVMSRRWA